MDVSHHRLPYRQVIPMLSGDATEQTPPDLPSFLFKERIVYLVRAPSCSGGAAPGVGPSRDPSTSRCRTGGHLRSGWCSFAIIVTCPVSKSLPLTAAFR